MFERLITENDLRTMELDFNGRASIGSLCKFCMDTADLHSIKMGYDVETLMEQTLSWMLLKFRMQVIEYPAGRQKIIVETWPSGAESRFAYREFRLSREGEEKPFAVATSVWGMIDLERGRPIRIPDSLANKPNIKKERIFTEDVKIPKPEGEPDLRMEFPVRLTDIDILQHVHNVRYIEWVAETVPDELWKTMRVSDISIEFRDQAKYGDTPISLLYNLENKQTERTDLHITNIVSNGPVSIRALAKRIKV
jgi:acyl-ACP thioesterase